MSTIRQIYKTMPSTIQIPDTLVNREVEVVLTPLDERKQQVDLSWIGKWQGEPISRPDQGDYEIRESLR